MIEAVSELCFFAKGRLQSLQIRLRLYSSRLLLCAIVLQVYQVSAISIHHATIRQQTISRLRKNKQFKMHTDFSPAKQKQTLLQI